MGLIPTTNEPDNLSGISNFSSFSFFFLLQMKWARKKKKTAKMYFISRFVGFRTDSVRSTYTLYTSFILYLIIIYKNFRIHISAVCGWTIIHQCNILEWGDDTNTHDPTFTSITFDNMQTWKKRKRKLNFVQFTVIAERKKERTFHLFIFCLEIVYCFHFFSLLFSAVFCFCVKR